MRFVRSGYVRSLTLVVVVTVVAAASYGLAGAVSSEQDAQYQNLQVLSAGASRGELSEAMLENLRGLGLPRRDGEGCLYCHVGDFDDIRADRGF